MRFDKLTVKAQEAVVRAQELAQQRNHAEVHGFGTHGSTRRELRGNPSDRRGVHGRPAAATRDFRREITWLY